MDEKQTQEQQMMSSAGKSLVSPSSTSDTDATTSFVKALESLRPQTATVELNNLPQEIFRLAKDRLRAKQCLAIWLEKYLLMQDLTFKISNSFDGGFLKVEAWTNLEMQNPTGILGTKRVPLPCLTLLLSKDEIKSLLEWHKP